MSNITISNNNASKIYMQFVDDEGVSNSVSSTNSEHSEPKNAFCDVTIHTSFTIPEYHIRIKNNYKNETSKSKHEEMKSIVTENSPFTKESYLGNLFSIDEDVLMKSYDDKLYLGTIVSIKNGKYLVKFDDNTEKWAIESNLKKLNSSLDKNQSEDPLCVVCKVKSKNDLVEVCNKCSRGYHRPCMSRNSSNFSQPWCCDRCTATEIISISDSEDNETEENVPIKPVLPYDLKSLHWDSNHRENKEQKYCYCGESGQWKNKMLRCCKCQQWFHEKCISFKGHLMHGDTFFLFCCKICNEGEEFLQRLELNMKDALHLILYELTITHAQKYYSISKEVVPFMWKSWNQLHFPMDKPNSKERLVKKISQTVKKEDEFKSFGGNNKKKGDFVYLRRRNQPAASPKINIPSSTPVNERELKKLSIKTFPLKEDEEDSLEVNDVKTEREKRKRKSYKDSKDLSGNPLQTEFLVDDSSDENSSKSALDWIIPPPSNFHGINNPFHSQYKPNAKISEIMAKKGFHTKVFEKLPETRIVRTIKRRLSAKDIAMGPNRETKRRKMMKRRKTDEVEIISEIIQPLTMPLPSFIPVRDFYKSENSSEPLKAQRQPKSESSVKPESVESPQTENKNSVNISLTDAVMNSPIKNKSINLYFGALNRIENGEHFTILAKRWTGGKEEFLLEWDSPTISKTD